MIHKVRVEYMRRNGTPGALIAVANKNGRIVYETKKAPPTTKRKDFDKREATPTKP